MLTKEEIRLLIQKVLSAFIIPYRIRFLSGTIDAFLIIFYVILMRSVVHFYLGMYLSFTGLFIGFIWLFAQFYVAKGTTVLQSFLGMKAVLQDGSPLSLHDLNQYMWETQHQDMIYQAQHDTRGIAYHAYIQTPSRGDMCVLMVSKKKWQTYITSEKYRELKALLDSK